MNKKLKFMLKHPIMTGVLVSSLFISSISLKMILEHNQFLRDKKRLPIAEFIEKNPINNPKYVGGGCYSLDSREKMLYTDGLRSCVGLGIDDKKTGIHYLEHLLIPCKEEVKYSITNNFENLDNLDIFLIEGSYKNTIGIRQTIKALKELGLLKRTKYYSSEKVGLKMGRLYIPDRNYNPF